MIRLVLLILATACLQCVLQGQTMVHGRVVDDRTQEPLAFVHVVPDGQREGATTDIDGRFTLQVRELPVVVRLSYVGYQPLMVTIGSRDTGMLRMQRLAVELRTVDILPGENPAHRIIRLAHANRRENDGMRNRSHRYNSYSKTILTAELDSALLADSLRMAKLDTSDLETIRFIESQHLFLMESATRKSFIPPDQEKEEVLAMRVSGLKDPSLLGLMAQTRTFSIYAPQIGISDRIYLGPLAPGSTSKYLFIIEDTLYQGRDSVFVISYRPRSSTRFDGLKGLLYINSDGWAVQNVTAEAAEREATFSIRFQQLHEKVGGKAWFPVQLNAFLYLDNVSLGPAGKPYGVNRTYLKDIELDAPVPRKEVRGPDLVMDRIAVRRPDAFWESIRTGPLDTLDLKTYHVIDSLGEEVDLDRKMKWFGRFATGRLPIGPADLLLDRVLHFNQYEGLRLGLGLATNDKVTKYASLGGYFAYGFQDKTWKYGGDLTIRPKPGRELYLKGYYRNDVLESGGVAFQGVPRMALGSESVRWFYVDRMDRSEAAGAELSFRVARSLKLWLGTERERRFNVIGYEYLNPVAEGVTRIEDAFEVSTVSLGLRYAYRERVARLPDMEFGMGTPWPVLYINATRAINGLWNADGEFWRVNAMLEKSYKLRLLGTFSFRLIGGMADDASPYAWLYNMRASNGEKFPVAVQNTFETMRPNEFLADRYVALHLRHSFGNLLFKTKRFRPVPVLVANLGWGDLARPERHRGYAFRSMEQGYHEAGLQIDAILRSGVTGIGVGLFHRFGPYATGSFEEDTAVKLTLGYTF